MNKQDLRAEMRKVRSGISGRMEKSACICDHLMALPEYQAARCILFYSAIGSEPDLAAAMECARSEGKRILLPVCGALGEMAAAEGALRRGAFGILEPQGPAVEPACIDLVCCPGLAFDGQGGRLGYGKGYYDRYLLKVHAFLAGICYTDCIIDHVPVDPHDMPMQALVCETGIKRMEV